MVEQFETYRTHLFSIAYRMLGSAMDAEDIVQEAYLHAQSTPTESIKSYKAFLTTIVIRLCLNQLNSARISVKPILVPGCQNHCSPQITLTWSTRKTMRLRMSPFRWLSWYCWSSSNLQRGQCSSCARSLITTIPKLLTWSVKMNRRAGSCSAGRRNTSPRNSLASKVHRRSIGRCSKVFFRQLKVVS